MSAVLVAATLLAAAMAGGCAGRQRRRQLERVAKDWCETVRASQVIPVYPLTEDLQPGDVFLVRAPIAQQAEEWRERGFLALDDHRVRLGRPDGAVLPVRPPLLPVGPSVLWSRMYFDGYWKDPYGAGGHPRVTIADSGPLIPGDGETAGDLARARISSAKAPRAAFPSYSFEVASGGGGSLALPVKGVPVGMSFMQTERASGMLTIADAYTYAADSAQLYDLLTAWASTPSVRFGLDSVVNQAGRPVYLRVVTRVYLAGAVAVTLVNSTAGGADGQVGSAPSVRVYDSTGEVSSDFTALLALLDEKSNTPLPTKDGRLLPGGAVKFVWATQRSVSLNEAFPTPLVIGYLGFDVPVYRGGQLGTPIPTWTVLEEGRFRTLPPVGDQTFEQRRVSFDLDSLNALAAERNGVLRQLRIMADTMDRLDAPTYFDRARRLTTQARRQPNDLAASRAAFNEFETATLFYVGDDLSGTVRAEEFTNAFSRAYDRHTAPQDSAAQDRADEPAAAGPDTERGAIDPDAGHQPSGAPHGQGT